MKYTLLKMVQLILSSMDSDEVNGISDTVESRQVVDIIETTYNDIMSTMDFPEQWDFFELTASGDTTKPTLMTLPSNVLDVDWLQYDNAEDTARQWKNVYRLQLKDYLDRMNELDTAETNVYSFNYTVDSQTFNFRGLNDAFPTYYCVIGDNTLIFDNYRSDLENTLVSNKTQGYGKLSATFSREDDYVPDLDAQNFSLLFNEAKSQAFVELKQVANAKADQRARQAKIRTQNNKERVANQLNMYSYPNYGRRSRKPH